MIEITKKEDCNYLLDETGTLTVVKGHTQGDDKVFVKLVGRLTNDASVALNRLSGTLSREVTT